MNPYENPKNIRPANSVARDWAKPIRNQPETSGMDPINKVVLRPYLLTNEKKNCKVDVFAGYNLFYNMFTCPLAIQPDMM